RPHPAPDPGHDACAGGRQAGRTLSAAPRRRPEHATNTTERTHMYQYDEYDQRIVDERVAQFADQTRRYLAGELREDEFRPLRLQNWPYIQPHAPMLRIAAPYGNLNSTQLRTLAHIARPYDRG